MRRLVMTGWRHFVPSPAVRRDVSPIQKLQKAMMVILMPDCDIIDMLNIERVIDYDGDVDNGKGRNLSRNKDTAPSHVHSPAYCVTFFPRQPLGQRDTRVTDAGQILTELSIGIKLVGCENCSVLEFRELIHYQKLALYNVVRQASREMTGQYLNRRMTRDCMG
jgi:hypothetical protein